MFKYDNDGAVDVSVEVQTCDFVFQFIDFETLSRVRVKHVSFFLRTVRGGIDGDDKAEGKD